MKKSLTSLLLIIATLATATPAMSAIKTASFQTSLTILESCRVDGSRGAPVVSCQMASSSHVSASSQSAAAVDGSPAWVVEF